MRRPEEVRPAVVTLVLMLAFAALHTCQAKRGCSAFGHSCFGGHGKRMDPSSAPEEMAYDQQAGLRDVVFTAPRGDALMMPPPLALLRQQEPQEQAMRLERQQEAYNLAPYLRQWLQAYRNSQDFRQNNM